MKRDLTRLQFEEQARKLGYVSGSFGYWMLLGYGISVYAANAGKRRRDQIKYLKDQKDKEILRRNNI